ncbi:hypothetical protein KKH23_07515 [Patescibacteria group bacterium]|nr:hypothetical protein [Patescibacteria group bacterium]
MECTCYADLAASGEPIILKCPLCKAAPKLYKALENALFDLQHGFFGTSPLVSDREAEIEKVLAEAEGKA